MSAARRYYERNIGSWSGHLTFRVTESLGAPFSVRMLGILTMLSRGAKMATTVEPRGDAFFHTTKVSRLGIPFVTTEETITIEPDGKRVSMKGTQNGEAYEATAEIDDDARAARYEIPWMGLTMIQSTKLLEEGRLEVVQRTPFSRAEVVLVRA